MIYIGIDPGMSGGIGLIFVNDVTGAQRVEAHRMPSTVADLLDLLAPHGWPRWTAGNVPARAMLERVNAGVFGHGKAGMRMGVVSAMTFGRGVGRLETALQASKIPYDEVSPAVWQHVLGCRTGGDKNISKARAQQLFPQMKITHAIADALLLAEYGRRLDRGQQAVTTNGGSDGKEEEGARTEKREKRQARNVGAATGEGARDSEGGALASQGAAQSAVARHGAGPRQRAR